jgi:SOS-response transcriptional repressor LexA
MADLGARIRKVLSEKNLTQSQLARLVGVKQQTVSYICSPDSPATTSRYATKIAQVLGVNPAWLQSGEGDQFDPMVRIELEGVLLSVVRVPLLAPSDVAPFLKTGENTNKRVMMTDSDIGKNAFAIEIEGESMAPTFKQGDRVVIDPSVAAEPGDFVAASIGGAVTFRKFRQREAGVYELVPLNSDWPTANSKETGIQILGVMIEHRSYRKPK